MTVRHWLGLAAAGTVLAFSLTGCASSSAGAALHESDYLKLARANVPEVKTWTDAKLDKVGKAACGSVKDGGKSGNAGWVQSVQVLTSSGFTGRHAGAFIAYAVSRYCPELKSYLPGTTP
jgi:hypothetical protein